MKSISAMPLTLTSIVAADSTSTASQRPPALETVYILLFYAMYGDPAFHFRVYVRVNVR
jgi:hypothetical protein